jgi:SagB-type dehydrogenase family enzyme
MSERLSLPQAKTAGEMSVEEAIHRRRSRRAYRGDPLTLQQAAQILWCAQGVTGDRGRKRAVPSAGATFPLVIYAAVGSGTVAGLAAGVHRYLPAEHALEQEFEGDVRGALAEAALGQDFLAEAPLVVLMAADHRRTTGRYGERGIRYVAMEAGHAAQGIHLQAESLGLATVAVGAFRDAEVAQVFRLPRDLEPLYLMPVGHGR